MLLRGTEAPAPTVATLTPVSHLRCQELWEFEWALVTRHADRHAHLQMDNLLLLPSGPLPSPFSRTRVELEGTHCMVEGVSWEWSHRSQDSVELWLVLKPTCCGVF
ncbi:unnamed protein product [Pipistrellus nathusii]|uniref:Uncharacterized protein n=1 Tax=Pipistrellus nathusii TaxID=59473 RepID=A0ABN9ZI00_PIPNA